LCGRQAVSVCLDTMPSSTLRFDLALLIVVSPFGVLCRHLTYRTGVDSGASIDGRSSIAWSPTVR
jgi:hypothetical protein